MATAAAYARWYTITKKNGKRDTHSDRLAMLFALLLFPRTHNVSVYLTNEKLSRDVIGISAKMEPRYSAAHRVRADSDEIASNSPIIANETLGTPWNA